MFMSSAFWICLGCLTIHRLCSALDCQLFLCWRHQGVFPFAIEGVADTVKGYKVRISKHHSCNNTKNLIISLDSNPLKTINTHRGDLTWAGGLVTPAVAGGPVFEVVAAVVGPQAAVVEAEDVIDPVRLTRNTRGLLVRRWAPVVCSVWRAAPNGVGRQDLSAGAVIATLLPGPIRRAVSKTSSVRTGSLLLFELN